MKSSAQLLGFSLSEYRSSRIPYCHPTLDPAVVVNRDLIKQPMMKKSLLLSAAIFSSALAWAQPAQLQLNMKLTSNSAAVQGPVLAGYEIFIWDYNSNNSGNGRSYFTDSNGELNKTITSQYNSGAGRFEYQVRDCQNQIVTSQTVHYTTSGAQVSFNDSIEVPCVDPCNVQGGVTKHSTNKYSFYSYAANQSWDMSNAEWVFSDGTSYTQQHVYKSFPAVGTYTWTLTHLGCAIDGGSIDITGTCNASFTVDTATSGAGSVNMYNTSVGTNPANTLYYHWDFGDGGTSNLPFPQHQYSGNGPYTVELSILEVDALGDTICESWAGDTLGIDSLGNILKAGFSVNIMDPSSIGIDEREDIYFNLFPQPASDRIRIEANDPLKKAELIDLNGRVVQTWEISGGHTSELQLNAHSAGMYILRIQSASDTRALKCILE